VAAFITKAGYLKRITSRNIEIAVREDSELARLFQN
jgi:hypothetical protein